MPKLPLPTDKANARGIATIYSAMASVADSVDDSQILSEAHAGETAGGQRVGLEDDLVLGRPIRRGAGVILNTNNMLRSQRFATWGHSGAGGSIGFRGSGRPGPDSAMP